MEIYETLGQGIIVMLAIGLAGLFLTLIFMIAGLIYYHRQDVNLEREWENHRREIEEKYKSHSLRN